MDAIYACSDCEKSFRSKTGLTKHIQSQHSQVQFECESCKKHFSRKFTLSRHMRLNHGSQEKFSCEFSNCKKSYKQKCELTRHMRSHNSQNQFECESCKKKFTRKDTLSRHILSGHGSQDELFFECAHCLLQFQTKTILRNHIERYHFEVMRKRTSKITRLKCLNCGNSFPRKKDLNQHYERQHNVTLVLEKFQLSSFEKFKEWLQREERETITHFISYNKYRITNGSINRLVCHRSKTYFNNTEVDDRKRSIKINGLKGLDGWCPSEIIVAVFDNGSCRITYQKVHVGHGVKDVKELKYMHLNEAEKLEIAGKIKAGVPRKLLLKQQLLSSKQNEGFDSSGLLSSKDLLNIASKYKLKFQNRRPTDVSSNAVDTETFVSTNSDIVLFYKRQGDEDSTFNKLGTKDIAIVIMSPTQADCLRQYGEKAIAMDSTRNTNRYGFILHALLILDTEEEAFPAAFLISNRNDQPVFDIFLTCICDKVGRINTHCLITDMQLFYSNSWTEIVAPPKHFLYCTWHVREAWRENYSKIVDKEKKTFVKKTVLDLAQETHSFEFERKLDSFLAIQDPDLKEFIQYFSDCYAKTAWRWACCYRQDPTINTNVVSEAFHKIFKQIVARCKAVQTVSQCLDYIREYTMLKEIEMRQKEIKGKVTSKLIILRDRHRKALSAFKNSDQINIFPICETRCLIDSFEKGDSNQRQYTISKKEFKACSSVDRNCLLFCTSCNICYHEYQCTCEDSAIKSNMCKHIHYLGLCLKISEDSTVDGADNSVLDSGTKDDDDSVAQIIVTSITESGPIRANTSDAEQNIESSEHHASKFESNSSCPYTPEIIAKAYRQAMIGLTPEELKIVHDQFILPIKPTIAAYRASSHQKLDQ